MKGYERYRIVKTVMNFRKIGGAEGKPKKGTGRDRQVPLFNISAGRRWSMEKVKCPNPKCGRRIFDIEEMPPGKVVLEMKCSDEEVLKKLYGLK